MSPTLLSTRLKQLVEADIIELCGNKGNHTYKLTASGLELRPIVELMGAWGHRWARSSLNDEDLDAGLLMWDMRRSIDPGVFPEQRIVVQFEYADAPRGAQNWWLVSENDSIDLCLNDNGYDVDIIISCSLKAMTEVWICQQTFFESVEQNKIKVIGDPTLTRKLQDWLRSSPLSKLGTLEELPTLDWSYT